VGVKLCNHATHSSDAAGKIAQHIKLISIVNTKIWINMPDENGIDRADPAFGLGQEAIDGVLALVRIVKTAVPDQQLHLGENVLRPHQFGPVVLRAVAA